MRRIRVHEVLGEGGLGRTVRGTWVDGDGPPFALKILDQATTRRRQTLREEFFSLRSLGHPNLVEAFDYGWFELHEPPSAPRRQLGIVLDLVPGVSLAEAGSSFEAVQVPLAHALEALDAMHRQGFVHGDVKPDNVRVRPDGQGVLLDLSAACRVGTEPTGETSGTPAYLAPEAGLVPSGIALDVFAVGRTLAALARRVGPLPEAVSSWMHHAQSPEASERPAGLGLLLELLRGPTQRSAHETFVPRLVGRTELVHELESAVRAGLDASAVPTVCLVGPRGAGHSRLLGELRWRLTEEADVHEAVESSLTPTVAATLSRASGLRVGGRSGILEAVRRLGRAERPVVLVFDRPRTDTREWLEALATELGDDCRGVVLVVASDTPLEAPHRRIDVAPLEVIHARALFPASFPDALVAHAQRTTHGLPGPLVALARQVDSFRPTLAAVDRALAKLAPAPAVPASLPPEPLATARALRLAGQSETAWPIVCIALRRRAADPLALRIEAAACLLARGRTRRAARVLERIDAEAASAPSAARTDLLAELALKSGRPKDALRLSTESVQDPTIVWSLAITRAAALVLLDDPDAEDALAHARRVALEPAAPRLSYRLASTEALFQHRRGAIADAERAYHRAAALVEREGLDDLRATASFNHATAAEQLGALGSAMLTYERTIRLARLAGAGGTEARARFALANLFLELGHTERTRSHALAASVRARAEGQDVLVALSLTLVAEATGPRERAEAFAAARDALPPHAKAGAEALDIALAEARGAPIDERRRDELILWAERVGSTDLLARALVLGPLDTGLVDRLEATLERLGTASVLRRLELHARLHALYTQNEAPSLADRHASNARVVLETVLVRLPLELRAPLRERFATLRPAPPPMAAVASKLPEEITQLLDVQRRLSTTTNVDDLLSTALDAAIVLAAAERGFVVLERPGGSLDVRAARNVDATKLSGRALSFSRSVVHEVLATSTPRFADRATVDLDDDFLSRQRSVHAQKLRAVVALPFRTEGGVRGALYLDNRFVATTPSPRAREVLLFLRDQIANALDRALLLSALEERNTELERKSQELELLLEDQRRELERRRAGAATDRTVRATAGLFPAIVGDSEPMQRALALVERVARTDITVLVEGESGTGKELFARAVHETSPRAQAPFLAINCGAMPETLLEAELFGTTKGAFTGSVRDTRGLFVAADGGTLFLDEIGEMSLTMQVKLLRVLQQREVRPLGSEAAVAVDVRVVIATHRSLEEEVRLGRFREDLFFRLAVVRIPVPPLRERGNDVVTIAEVILEREANRLGLPRPALAPSALRALVQHRFPGNVRELENVLTKALVLGGPGETLEAEHLGLPPSRWVRTRRAPADEERKTLQAALDATNGNVVQAAKRLGMPRATFYRKLARYALLERP